MATCEAGVELCKFPLKVSKAMTYPTIDFIRDLTSLEKNSAIELLFKPEKNQNGFLEDYASIVGMQVLNPAPRNPVYKFKAEKGANYFILAYSPNDPNIIIYDNLGNAVANGVSIDHRGVDGLRIDVERDWIAPYSGYFYIKPEWKGLGDSEYSGSYALSVTRNIDPNYFASKDKVYVFKSEKTGPKVEPNSHSYFYTTSKEEADFIKSQPQMPWVEKTATFEAAHSNPALSVPVHRFFSEKYQSHFFTISNEEKNQIIDWSSTGKNDYDWKYEGEGFRVYTDPTPKDALGKSAVPVYRMWLNDKDFNPNNGESGGHYFTADQSEYESMVKLTGVNGEGIAFYGEVLGA